MIPTRIIPKQTMSSGKRKTAIARAVIKAGKGNVLVNKRPVSSYPYLQQLEVSEPIVLAQKVLGDEIKKIDIEVKVIGGGIASQIEAARLAIAKAILKHTNSEELKFEYLRYDRNMVIADTRRKEPYKPGDSKARSRRQTSYR
jgi:small subunit ribosomal protein S9